MKNSAKYVKIVEWSEEDHCCRKCSGFDIRRLPRE